jgi:hypothetical protein
MKGSSIKEICIDGCGSVNNQLEEFKLKKGLDFLLKTMKNKKQLKKEELASRLKKIYQLRKIYGYPDYKRYVDKSWWRCYLLVRFDC